MNRYSLLLLLSLMGSCSLSEWTRHDLSQNDLHVVSVTPESESLVSEVSQVEIVFSEALFEDSVNAHSIFIMPSEDYAAYADDWKTLKDELEDGDVSIVSNEMNLSSDKQLVTLQLVEELIPEIEYVVVVLPSVQSADFMPLDQTSVGSVTSQFQSSFLVMDEDKLNDVSVSSNPGEDRADDDLSEDFGQNSLNEGSYPAVASVQDGENDGSGMGETEDVAFDWARVLITEVVTDPQQDHNESTPGNGILFDSEPGTGTVGSTDEYVEIFNGTDEEVDASLWTLNMKDGTDESQALNDESLDRYFSVGGSLEDVAPGEFLVLGNPSGSMNNTITIELIDENGDVVDAVDVDDANATGLEDESYYLDPAGVWLHGEVSPGFF